MKRVLDVLASIIGLLVAAPVILPVMWLVWRQDGHSPFYVAPRVAKGGGTFSMVKLRSMVKNADRSGVDSTAATDMRITPIGHFIRRYKLDEITQLWNVLIGEMSLVGPRPNVKRETDLYTEEERRLLQVQPGITDLASIVFADEAEILNGHHDPDLAYNQLIRPGKSRLGLFYLEKRSLMLDVWLCVLTLTAILSRERALAGVAAILRTHGAGPDLIDLARRQSPLVPAPPPGAMSVVTSRLQS